MTRDYQPEGFDIGCCPVQVEAMRRWRAGRTLSDDYETHCRLMYAREARLTGGTLVNRATEAVVQEADLMKVDLYALSVLYDDGAHSKNHKPDLPECPKCGSIDLTKTGVCKPCNSEKQRLHGLKVKAERLAKYVGQKFFEGTACKKCGGTKRRVSDASCATCPRWTGVKVADLPEYEL